MTTVGRWSPNKVRARVLDGTWASPPEELGGMVLLTPTSIAYTGTSASIGANGSVEFSACETLSLNGVFSADYDNYMVAVRHKASVGSSIFGRLRDGTPTDASGSDYTRQYLYAYSTNIAAARETSQTSFRTAGTQPGPGGMVVFFYGPHLSQQTAIRSVTVLNSSGAELIDSASTHSLSTSYSGFTLLHSTAGVTDTGLVSVYGLVGA